MLISTDIEKTATKNPGKNWVFTWNNYTDEDIELLKTCNYKYIIIAKETAPTTGTKHLQGYIQFIQKIRLSAIKKLFGKKAAWYMAKGTPKQQLTYCSKDDKTPFVDGKPVIQGQRTDLQCLKEQIMEGKKTVNDITLEYPDYYHQYGRTLEKLEDIYHATKKRTEVTKGKWIFGPTGVGKSHSVWSNNKHSEVYKYKDDNGWWDKYKHQRVCFMDEFRGSIPYGEMLELADKWPTEVRRRGREPIPFTSKEVIVCSALPPWEAYKNLGKTDRIDQLLRRFEVWHMPEKGVKTLLEPDEIHRMIEEYKVESRNELFY